MKQLSTFMRQFLHYHETAFPLPWCRFSTSIRQLFQFHETAFTLPRDSYSNAIRPTFYFLETSFSLPWDSSFTSMWQLFYSCYNLVRQFFNLHKTAFRFHKTTFPFLWDNFLSSTLPLSRDSSSTSMRQLFYMHEIDFPLPWAVPLSVIYLFPWDTFPPTSKTSFPPPWYKSISGKV